MTDEQNPLSITCIGNPMTDHFILLPEEARMVTQRITEGLSHVSAGTFGVIIRKLEELYPESVQSMKIIPGGGALTTSAVLAEQGKFYQVIFSGAVGDDQYGRMINQYLSNLQIQVRLQKHLGHTGRMLYCQYSRNGACSGYQAIGSPGAALEYRYSDNKISVDTDMYLEGFLPDASGVWDHALRGRNIYVDLGSTAAAAHGAALASHAETFAGKVMVIGTELEMRHFEKHYAKGSHIAGNLYKVIKLGAQGAAFCSQELCIQVSAKPLVKKPGELETVGAGDAFSGGFLAEMIKNNHRIEEECISSALERGNTAAAALIHERILLWESIFR